MDTTRIIYKVVTEVWKLAKPYCEKVDRMKPIEDKELDEMIVRSQQFPQLQQLSDNDTGIEGLSDDVAQVVLAVFCCLTRIAAAEGLTSVSDIFDQQ